MHESKTKRRSNTKERRWRNDLAQERRARHLSLQQAARILNIPMATLGNYERGNYPPSLDTALKLQILYRGQIASLFDALYAKLAVEVRQAEAIVTGKRGSP